MSRNARTWSSSYTLWQGIWPARVFPKIVSAMERLLRQVAWGGHYGLQSESAELSATCCLPRRLPGRECDIVTPHLPIKRVASDAELFRDTADFYIVAVNLTQQRGALCLLQWVERLCFP